MNSKSAMLAMAAMLGATAAFGANTTNACAWTCLNTDASLQWKTIAAATMPVALDWPANAVKAEITGGSETVTVTDTAQYSADVAFALPTNEKQERIVTLGVTYYGDGDVAISSETKKLALVLGTTDGAVRVKNKTATCWGSAKSAKPVLPIPEGTTALAVDGTPVEDFDIPARGWHAVALSDAGTTLQLTVAEAAGATTYTATVYPPKGLCFVIQ